MKRRISGKGVRNKHKKEKKNKINESLVTRGTGRDTTMKRNVNKLLKKYLK